MTDKMTDLQEAVAGVLTNYFDHPYDMLHNYVAVDILNELKYHDLIALVLERDKEIAELKTQISFERDINAGREDQLDQDIKHLRAEQRKRIADFKEEIEKNIFFFSVLYLLLILSKPKPLIRYIAPGRIYTFLHSPSSFQV